MDCNSQGGTAFPTHDKEQVVSVEPIEGEDAEEGDGDAGEVAEGGEE